MKILKVTGIMLCACLFFASCVVLPDDGASGQDVSPSDVQSVGETVSDPTDDARIASGEFTASSSDGDISQSGSAYTVTSAGEYELSGSIEDGQIIVNAGDDDEVTLVLKDFSISCSYSAPILVLNAKDVTIKAESGTYNTVTDLRAENSTDEQSAAIWSSVDLKISGKGTLIVKTDYNDGIKSSDDLTVKNVTMKVTAVGNALSGSDSVTVESGELILISTSSDGIKTSNSDISSKGNQRGNVTVLGGNIDIYSLCDGISAACNVEIAPEGDCTVNIFTSTYSEYGGESAAGSDIYLIVPKASYSSSNDYYFYFYNSDDREGGVWKKCEYDSPVYSGRTASYYGLKTKLQSGYENMLVCIVASGQTPNSETYVAISDGETVNTSMNSYLISVSGSAVSGDWVQLSSGSGSQDKSAYSSKGIKAYNEINISGGNIAIYCMDDGLHSNADALENNETGKGNINITGGSVTITAADDGMHADGVLTISGGYVNVVKSHEGLEANVINIAGGTVYVYGDDDGLNACRGSYTTLINITGGYLNVTTPSGDTDAIDSNGSFTMSGGFVLVKGGSSSGMVAGSIDVDGSITVTGGTLIALGGICETPSSGSVNTFIQSGTSFSAGEYTLTDSSGNKILSFELNASYTSVWIASDALAQGETYTLKQDGSQVLSWTQDSATVGSSQGGGFGGGGFPGGGRR